MTTVTGAPRAAHPVRGGHLLLVWPKSQPEAVMGTARTGLFRHLAGSCLAILLVTPSPLAAQDTRTVDVLGSITAEIGGEQLEWLTIAGEFEDADQASAVWSPHEPAMPAEMMEQMDRMSEQQRAMMAQILGGASNPLGGGGDAFELRITGFDPDAERMFREGMLSIDLTSLAADDMDAALAKSHDVTVSYFRNRGPETGLYVSDHSVGTGAKVDFDKLEIGDGDGHAKGRFTATLCPISTLMGESPDPETCVSISGAFATDLMEDAPPGGAQ